MNPSDKISANKVAQYLDITVVTLNNWYYWYNSPESKKPQDTPYLPPYSQLTPRGKRYWDKADLRALRKFQKWLPRGRGGVMGIASSRYWGSRNKNQEV